MIELFYMGGTLFMGILTLTLIGLLTVCIYNCKRIFIDSIESPKSIRRSVSYLRSIGLLAFVIGLLGQLIGMYSAFQYIEEANNITPEILAGGLKVSSITTIYGMIIFIIAFILWFILDYALNSKTR